MQLGLLDYRAPENTSVRESADQGAVSSRRRRTTTSGLSTGVRIAVRRNRIRAADRGTITDVFEDRGIVRYRSDRNGGFYDVELDRVKLLKRPKVRTLRPRAQPLVEQSSAASWAGATPDSKGSTP